jgi:hypothetical protein
MEKLESDDVVLTAPSCRSAAGDIVRFVPFFQLLASLVLTVAQAACRPTSKETLEHSFIEMKIAKIFNSNFGDCLCSCIFLPRDASKGMVVHYTP